MEELERAEVLPAGGGFLKPMGVSDDKAAGARFLLADLGRSAPRREEASLISVEGLRIDFATRVLGELLGATFPPSSPETSDPEPMTTRFAASPKNSLRPDCGEAGWLEDIERKEGIYDDEST